MDHRRLTVTCTDGDHPVTRAAAAFARRCARYPEGSMHCYRYLGARWLCGRGTAARLFQEELSGPEVAATPARRTGEDAPG